MRKIEIDLCEILDLVACSETYGFGDDVLLDAFASWVLDLTDEEVEVFLRESYLTPKARKLGYTEEDYENAQDVIGRWRTKYIKPRLEMPDAESPDSEAK